MDKITRERLDIQMGAFLIAQKFDKLTPDELTYSYKKGRGKKQKKKRDSLAEVDAKLSTKFAQTLVVGDTDY